MGFFDSGIGSLIGGLLGRDNNTPQINYTDQSQSQKMIQDLLSKYLASYGRQMTGQTPVPQYTGQLTAGLNPTQTQSISNIGGLQNLGESGDVLSQIMKMVSGQNFNPSYMRAAYKTGIEDPLKRTFTETTMPALESSYAKSGLFYGSDRATATGNEVDTLMNALAVGRTGLESNIYTAGLANQQQGISDFSQWLADQGGLTTQGLAAGQVQQNTEQAGLTNQYNQWLRGQAGTMPTDTLLQSILNMYKDTSQEAVVTPKKGLIGSILS